MFVSNPWDSKTSLRWFLSRFNEEGELDAYMIVYARDILGHKIVRRPSKGPRGEDGKDFAAVENPNDNSYCSYIIKKGNLHSKLYGKYGIMNQMREAMFIPLEEKKYKNSKRSARVVHNGYEGYRGAIEKFEAEKQSLEQECGDLLLREIERWDIDEIVDRLFPHRENFQKYDEIKKINNIREEVFKCAVNYYVEKENEKIGDDDKIGDTFTIKMQQLESEYGYSFKNLYEAKNE